MDQPRQFETPDSARQRGGCESTLAGRIRLRMQVVDAEGQRLGTVIAVNGDHIMLERPWNAPGNRDEPHFILLSQVASVEDDRVRLTAGDDSAYGVEATH